MAGVIRLGDIPKALAAAVVGTVNKLARDDAIGSVLIILFHIQTINNCVPISTSVNCLKG
jgi:hypothetical protein